MKRILALVGVVLWMTCLILSAFAGGNHAVGKDGNSDSLSGPPATLRVMVVNNMGNDPSKVRFTKMTEEATNTKLVSRHYWKIG